MFLNRPLFLVVLQVSTSIINSDPAQAVATVVTFALHQNYNVACTMMRKRGLPS